MAEPGRPPACVGLLGAGVIGGGWAARFLLHGVDVRVFDPDPGAQEKMQTMLANARRAQRRLTLAPLPAEGTLTIASSPEDAVDGVDFVQESAPEREPLKRALLAQASRAASDDVVFASSTSGLRPTALQADMHRPERLTIGHPFNPVYLLPLVELCGGERTDPATLDRAAEVYQSVGMATLRVRKEVDGFIADRLLEALWREALWLVADDIATVAEVDDAIRLGAGLRWSFMGTYMTYRIAGGQAGMRHFIAQFGPTLEWPWTHLTDVPELTDALIDKIVAQSDEQAGGRSITELEQQRDDCLVAVLQGLRQHGVGAGAVLSEHERALFDTGNPRVMGDADDLSRPLRLHRARVLPEWVDYNGHAHESRQLQVFGDATDALLRYLGVDAAYLAAGGSYYTIETHLSHLRQLIADDRVEVSTQVLASDDKRLHVFHRLLRTGADEELATAEQMLLHVNAGAGRAAPAAGVVLERVQRLTAAHAGLTRPDHAGRSIGAPTR
jgi:carnitine 3-dehydrogenase